jgi:hypothetical protein
MTKNFHDILPLGNVQKGSSSKAARSEEDEAYEWYGESYELGERRWWPFSTLPIGIPRHRFPY